MAGASSAAEDAELKTPAAPQIPAAVERIARTLEDAGFETWCVGGAVRDHILGDRNSDFDLATRATPEQVRSLFRRTVDVGAEFGTIGVLDEHRKLHEVTTFRRDVSTDGRRAVVAFGVDLKEDLSRRDFTINAIAFRPRTGAWEDPFEGLADLEAGVVRAVGVPVQRFREDYLRILRGVRFAARFDFEIEAATWQAARAEAHGIRGLSAERVREEWFKSLRTARSLPRLVDLWHAVIGGSEWMPELLTAPPRDPGPEFPRDPVLLSVFLMRGAEAALARLKGSRAEVERAAALGTMAPAPAGPGEVDVRRWLATVTPSIARDLLELERLRSGAEPMWAGVVRRVVERGDPVSRGDLALSGVDLLAEGIAAGPEVGRVLAALLEFVLEDPRRNSRDALLERLKEIR